MTSRLQGGHNQEGQKFKNQHAFFGGGGGGKKADRQKSGEQKRDCVKC